MNARTILIALLLALCAASCGKSDPSKPKPEESSSAPGYDLPTPPADDEKKK